MPRRRLAPPTASWRVALPPCPAAPSRAQALVADLSHHLIAITTASSAPSSPVRRRGRGRRHRGHRARAAAGPDRAAQGPRRRDLDQSRTLAFRDAPGYYAVASTGPFEQSRGRTCWRATNSGRAPQLEPIDAAGSRSARSTAFQDALIRRKQEQGLYSRGARTHQLPRRRLFRTTWSSRRTCRPGSTRSRCCEMEDGFATDAQRSTLVVSKVGLEADLFDFAQQPGAPLWLGGDRAGHRIRVARQRDLSTRLSHDRSSIAGGLGGPVRPAPSGSSSWWSTRARR